MFRDILGAISKSLTLISRGHNVIDTIADVRRDMQSARSATPSENIPAEPLELLENRLRLLESQVAQHNARTAEVERACKAALRATEALRQRARTIFWIATVACGLALIGLTAALLALGRTIR